jgi:hypothetical protein
MMAGMSQVVLITLATVGVLLLVLGPVLVYGMWRTGCAGRRLRQVQRVAHGRCPGCNYSVMGQLSDRCAECGYEFTTAELRRLEGIYVGLKRMRERGLPP